MNRRTEFYLEIMNINITFAQTFVLEGGLKWNARRQGTLYVTGIKLSY